jgi:hypothetical protein
LIFAAIPSISRRPALMSSSVEKTSGEIEAARTFLASVSSMVSSSLNASSTSTAKAFLRDP